MIESVFDGDRAHGPHIYDVFDRKRSESGIYNVSLNQHLNATNHYSFLRDQRNDLLSTTSTSNMYEVYSGGRRTLPSILDNNSTVSLGSISIRTANSYESISNSAIQELDSGIDIENWFSLCLKRKRTKSS